MKEKGIEKTREYKERAKRENWYTVPNAISASRLTQINFSENYFNNIRENVFIIIQITQRIQNSGVASDL